MKITKKFIKLFFILVNSKKVWSIPRKSDVIIFDYEGYQLINRYLSAYRVDVLHVRGELINIYCLIHSIFRIEFWKGRFYDAYIYSYIRSTEPIMCITFIDNNTNFYRLGQYFNKMKTMLIQNGWRDNWLLSYSDSEAFNVNYMFVFNKWIGNYYSNKINGEIIVSGSLRNNNNKITKKLIKNSIIYISTFIENNGSAKTLNINGEELPYEDFIKAEIILLNYLKEWCKTNGKCLKVAGCILGGSDQEREFYAQFLDDKQSNYIARKTIYSSYDLVDSAEIVVTIDSTLGYESFARGIKTGFFSFRGDFINKKDRTFGWPGNYDGAGPFWTCSSDIKEFERVINFINLASMDVWGQIYKKYQADIMAIDPENSLLIGKMDEVLRSHFYN